MPIYEYLCGACEHRLDALQRLSDEPLLHCPHCGKPQLRRQLSAPRFRLKGSGWYETDFKNDRRRNIAESDSKAADKPDQQADGKPKDKDKGKAGKPEAPASPAPAAEKPSGAGATSGKPAGGKAGDLA